MLRDPSHFEVVDEAMADVLRQKTESKRLAIAFRMWAFARDMIDRQVRSECPGLPESDIRRLVARRMSHGAC